MKNKEVWDSVLTDAIVTTDGKIQPYDDIKNYLSERFQIKRTRVRRNKRFLQPERINRKQVIEKIKGLMDGLDKAKHYSRYRAYQDCLVLIEESEAFI